MPLDAIEAFNYYAITVCLNEVVVQENSPYSVDEFLLAMRQKVGVVLAVRNVRKKPANGIWKLISL